MRKILLKGLLAGFLMAGPLVAGSAQAQQAAPQKQEPADKSSEEIVVEGMRLDREKIVRSLFPVPSEVGYKRVSDAAEIFARCAKHPAIKYLREVVEGRPNSAPFRVALDRIIRTNSACYPSLPMRMPDEPYFGDCNPVVVNGAMAAQTVMGVTGPTTGDNLIDQTTCRTVYDRAALLAEAIRRYVPDLSLSRKEVADPAVQARLVAREVPRNKFRLPSDQTYFQVAICMVGAQPDLATRMVRAHGNGALQQQLGQLLMVRSKQCVGDARRLKVEPGQFAAYITDALYRWVEAARNVESLLPADG